MPFIERIQIRDHYRIKELDVDLREDETELVHPRHILFTGVNGSGKTTILDKLAEEIELHLNGNSTAQNIRVWDEYIRTAEQHLSAGGYSPIQVPQVKQQILHARNRLDNITFHLLLGWSHNVAPPALQATYQDSKFFSIHLPVNRQLPKTKVQGPVRLSHELSPPRKSRRQQLVQYLVNLHVQAKLAETPEERQAISSWLQRIETTLSKLFGVDDLAFVFRRKDFSLSLSEGGRLEYGFDHLPAGYMSVLVIIAEILLRLGVTEDVAHTINSPDISGVVIIDELGAHLHPAMQERVLPALVDFFPRFQFVVATHSPAIISSIDNATVVDLPSGETIASTSLRGTRYGDLMMEHFGIPTDFDLQSTDELKRLSVLTDMETRSAEEESEARRLANKLMKTSHPVALEAWMLLNQ